MFPYTYHHGVSGLRSRRFHPQLEELEGRNVPAVVSPAVVPSPISIPTNPNSPSSSALTSTQPTSSPSTGTFPANTATTTTQPTNTTTNTTAAPGQQGQTGDTTFTTGTAGTTNNNVNANLVSGLNANITPDHPPLTGVGLGATEMRTSPLATEVAVLAQANALAQAQANYNLLAAQNAFFAQQQLLLSSPFRLVGGGGDQAPDLMGPFGVTIHRSNTGTEEQEEPPPSNVQPEPQPAEPNNVPPVPEQAVEDVALPEPEQAVEHVAVPETFNPVEADLLFFSGL